jgi:hypothetical protein
VKYSNLSTSIRVSIFLQQRMVDLRDTLNHFRRTRRMPETALAVISRDLIASISSIGKSDVSTALGRGMLAGSCGLFWPTLLDRRLVSDLKLGPRPPWG